MVSSVPMNMGYNNNPYILMPLNKTSDNGLSVKCSTPITEYSEEFMDNLNDIKVADANRDNIISLNELKNFEGKTEFAQIILEMMEKYAQNFKYNNYNI